VTVTYPPPLAAVAAKWAPASVSEASSTVSAAVGGATVHAPATRLGGLSERVGVGAAAAPGKYIGEWGGRGATDYG